MKVAYCSEGFGPHDFRFLSAITTLGHSVYHVQVSNHSNRTDARATPACETFMVHGNTVHERILGVRRILRQVRPDLIHAGPVPSVAYPVMEAFTAPTVVMSWGSDLLGLDPKDSASMSAARHVCGRANAFLCDCRAVESAALALGLTAPTVVLPWGVDLETFSPSGSSMMCGSQDGIVVLCCRSWEPLYSVETLAKAFVSLSSERADLQLVLVGSGSREAMIRSIIAEPMKLGRVSLLGSVAYSDMPALYRAADIYVSPSLSDGSSVSLLEAMSCALPVLVTDIPGNREWVESGRNGALFAPGDVTMLAHELDRVSRLGAEMRRRWGREGRAIVELRADWSANICLIARAYDIATRRHES